jgi:hypothetical protein
MLPSAPQPLVEARPQACALASRPRPSPVGRLLQTRCWVFVLRFPSFLFFNTSGRLWQPAGGPSTRLLSARRPLTEASTRRRPTRAVSDIARDTDEVLGW